MALACTLEFGCEVEQGIPIVCIWEVAWERAVGIEVWNWVPMMEQGAPFVCSWWLGRKEGLGIEIW